jgi:hypothetical protein
MLFAEPERFTVLSRISKAARSLLCGLPEPGTKNIIRYIFFDFIKPADSCGFFVLKKEQRIWII